MGSLFNSLISAILGIFFLVAILHIVNISPSIAINVILLTIAIATILFTMYSKYESKSDKREILKISRMLIISVFIQIFALGLFASITNSLDLTEEGGEIAIKGVHICSLQQMFSKHIILEGLKQFCIPTWKSVSAYSILLIGYFFLFNSLFRLLTLINKKIVSIKS